MPTEQNRTKLFISSNIPKHHKTWPRRVVAARFSISRLCQVTCRLRLPDVSCSSLGVDNCSWRHLRHLRHVQEMCKTCAGRINRAGQFGLLCGHGDHCGHCDHWGHVIILLSPLKMSGSEEHDIGLELAPDSESYFSSKGWDKTRFPI